MDKNIKMSIADNYKKIRYSIPDDITIVVAAKQRTPIEVIEVIKAGATDIGENYIQEAENMYITLGDISKNIKWHIIGTLQKNKINKAINFSDIIQTIDSIDKADAIETRMEKLGKSKIDVLIEVNSGKEASKSGIISEKNTLLNLANHISKLKHIQLKGIMTMGPFSENPEESRPYFKIAKELFDYIITQNILNVDMKILSMGMSNSYKVAIEEGATMVRIGTAIFGPRKH